MWPCVITQIKITMMNAREGNSRHGWIAYGYIQGYILQSHTRESSSHHGWIAYEYRQGAYIAKIHTREGSSRHGWIAYGYYAALFECMSPELRIRMRETHTGMSST